MNNLKPILNQSQNVEQQRIPEPNRLITDELLKLAAVDYSKPREWRRQIYEDWGIETRAMRTVCKDGRTIKQVVDDLVFVQHCTNWVRRGSHLYISNADNINRYDLPAQYSPYLHVALRVALGYYSK